MQMLVAELWRFFKYQRSGVCSCSLQAYCFSGDTLLEEDQCGKAIRALRESDKRNS